MVVKYIGYKSNCHNGKLQEYEDVNVIIMYILCTEMKHKQPMIDKGGGYMISEGKNQMK